MDPPIVEVTTPDDEIVSVRSLPRVMGVLMVCEPLMTIAGRVPADLPLGPELLFLERPLAPRLALGEPVDPLVELAELRAGLAAVGRPCLERGSDLQPRPLNLLRVRL